MVHALTVIRGLLRPHGVLVDLRTDRFASRRARHDQIYCLTGNRRLYGGPLKIARPLADFRAADRAIREVVRRGLFHLEAADVFKLRSYYDSPATLVRAAAGNPYMALEPRTLRRLTALLRRHPAAHVVVVAQTRVNVLVKS